jgi:hypothetical protein
MRMRTRQTLGTGYISWVAGLLSAAAEQMNEHTIYTSNVYVPAAAVEILRQLIKQAS